MMLRFRLARNSSARRFGIADIGNSFAMTAASLTRSLCHIATDECVSRTR
jgi:hypothetical protein